LDLGVGSGWQREEFEASDLPFVGRTQRMDDTVRACQALWRDCPATFSSETISFTDIYCEPSPIQPDGIPIWFGGPGNEATANRIAEMGVGWLPVAGTPDDELTEGIDLMRAAFAEAGRDPASAGVRVGLTAARDADNRPSLARTVEAAAALQQMGVSMVSLALGRFVRDKDAIAPFMKELADAFAA
jgi:alkanesulfonate monooxygenase SsuD/methylene tetrahydromethanopterin reductase-like flavin-dependent oxidoreductase (luciferase family)